MNEGKTELVKYGMSPFPMGDVFRDLLQMPQNQG